MLGSLLMASSDPEETFKVTDRRRRVQDDEPARPAPPGAPTPSAQRERPRPAREPERDLTGLFVMLASSAAIAMGDAADPVTGERHYDLRSPAPVRRGDEASRITTGAASIVSIRVAPTPTYHNR
ncbi:MAG: hypothetical protein DMD88_14770 [Candidatus Rokuibacteriota bacterium]|nr:MAG: hypothetical protein DMD88_14770 [Candidatus Rokubacteria bacterium]